MQQGAFLLKFNQAITCISYLFSIINKNGIQKKLLKTLHLDFLAMAIIACFFSDENAFRSVILPSCRLSVQDHRQGVTDTPVGHL